MTTQRSVQYTIRGIRPEVDQALRRKARRKGISLNQLLVEELSAAGDETAPPKYRDLSDLRGLWQEDEDFDRILVEQRRIDEDLWK